MGHKDRNTNKQIIRTWLTGYSSCTLIIPLEFARGYGLDQPCHVIVEQKPEGILIKKIDS
jgi:hypothetical protein